MSVFAGLIDWLACAFSLGEYRKCGHVHIDLAITGLGLSLTIVASYAWRLWWKERATRRAGSMPPESPAKPDPPIVPPPKPPERP